MKQRSMRSTSPRQQLAIALVVSRSKPANLSVKGMHQLLPIGK